MTNKLKVNQYVGMFMTTEKMKALRTFKDRIRSKNGLVTEHDVEEFIAAGFTQESVSKIVLGSLGLCKSRSISTLKSCA